MRRLLPLALIVPLALVSPLHAAEGPMTDVKQASSTTPRVFEMRTYYPFPGRAEAMNKRFRDHTCTLFKKHGMELIGFWTPQDEKKKDLLIYILAYPSKEAAAASWKAFQSDPEWVKVRDESEKDGKIVQKVDSVYMNPTDYSAIK
jgi:hypothetical protein